MVFRETDEIRILKEKTRVAVSLAMEGKWADAAIVNRDILESSPQNIESLNRLGKALIELNQLEEALTTFTKVIGINPSNTIAVKNVERLNWANANKSDKKFPTSISAGSLNAKFFIGQSGKSTEVTLAQTPLSCDPSPGTPITLERDGSAVVALDPCGNRLGYVPSKLSRRLLCLIDGGNKYDGAVSGRSEGSLRAILRECYQDPSQRSRISFPLNTSWGPSYHEENNLSSDGIEIGDPRDAEIVGFETSNDSGQFILVGASVTSVDDTDDELLQEDLKEEIAN